MPVFQLTEIRRQQDPAYRQAVARLARGDAFGAFNRFSALGAVNEIRDLSSLFMTAADDYVRTVRSGKSCLAISPVLSEIHQFTDEVRRQLRVGVIDCSGRTDTHDRRFPKMDAGRTSPRAELPARGRAEFPPGVGSILEIRHRVRCSARGSVARGAGS